MYLILEEKKKKQLFLYAQHIKEKNHLQDCTRNKRTWIWTCEKLKQKFMLKASKSFDIKLIHSKEKTKFNSQ